MQLEDVLSVAHLLVLLDGQGPTVEAVLACRPDAALFACEGRRSVFSGLGMKFSCGFIEAESLHECTGGPFPVRQT